MATIALVAVTGGLVWFASRQARDMKDAIASSEKSANAAMDSNKIARDLFTAEQRPYIYMVDVDRIRAESDDAAYSFYSTFSIFNCGKTPAILREIRIRLGQTHCGEPLDPPSVDDNHELVVNPIIQPGVKRSNIKEWIDFSELADEYFIYDESQDVFPSFKNLKEDCIFEIKIAYDGPLTSGHESGSMWLYRHGQWLRRGGEERNYMR